MYHPHLTCCCGAAAALQDLLNSMFFADYCQGVPDTQDEQQADAHTPPQPDIQLDDANIKVRCSSARMAIVCHTVFLSCDCSETV
jgi:hypothetical protein